MGSKRVKKSEKRVFLILRWLVDPLLSTRMLFKSFKLPNYMTTRVRHLRVNLLMIKLTLQLTSHEVRESKNFGDFSTKILFVWRHQMTSYFFVHHHDWNVSFSGQFAVNSERGSKFPKEYSLTGFKKMSF